jgi:hypothetical protein
MKKMAQKNLLSLEISKEEFSLFLDDLLQKKYEIDSQSSETGNVFDLVFSEKGYSKQGTN